MKTILLSIIVFFCFTSEAQITVKFNKTTNNLTFYSGSKVIATGIEKYNNVNEDPYLGQEPPSEAETIEEKVVFDLVEKSKKAPSFPKNRNEDYFKTSFCCLEKTRSLVFSGEDGGVLKKDTILRNGIFYIIDIMSI